jgi:hypothetical protein
VVAQDLEAKSLRAAIATADHSGFRKAELFQTDVESDFLHGTNVAWYIGGVFRSGPLTEAEYMSLSEGDFCVITPPRSKADQFGKVWVAHPLYFRLRHSAKNAALAIRDLMIARLHHGIDSSGALFVGNDKAPLKASSMANWLYRSMLSIGTPADIAKLYTWHSWRIGLASRLAAAQVPDATIQTLLRWQSDESLRAYKRLSMQDQSAFIEAASEASIAAVQTSNLPILDQFDFFVALNNMVESV